jgi:hypothetical protein
MPERNYSKMVAGIFLLLGGICMVYLNNDWGNDWILLGSGGCIFAGIFVIINA